MCLQDLVNAQSRYIMALDLQLTYLVTPVSEDILSEVSKGQSSQWAKFLEIYSQLVDRDKLLRRIAECCGITSDFYNRSDASLVPCELLSWLDCVITFAI